MKKRIIFDLDGTLVDVVDFRESIRKTFEYFGLDYTQDNIEGYYQGMIDYEDYFSYYGFNEYYLFLKKNCGIDFGPELIQHYISTPENLLPKCVDSNVFDTLDYLAVKDKSANGITLDETGLSLTYNGIKIGETIPVNIISETIVENNNTTDVPTGLVTSVEF